MQLDLEVVRIRPAIIFPIDRRIEGRPDPEEQPMRRCDVVVDVVDDAAVRSITMSGFSFYSSLSSPSCAS